MSVHYINIIIKFIMFFTPPPHDLSLLILRAHGFDNGVFSRQKVGKQPFGVGNECSRIPFCGLGLQNRVGNVFKSVTRLGSKIGKFMKQKESPKSICW